MKYSWVILWLGLATTAVAQDTPRAIVERAVTAHGGVENILKLRKAKVAYNLFGIVPGKEFLGKINVEVAETYDLPKIKKVIDGRAGGLPVEVAWAISGNHYWFQENRGAVQWKAFDGDAEQIKRPFQVIEWLVGFLRKDVTLEGLGEAKAIIAQKDISLIGVAVADRSGHVGDYYFAKESGLLAKFNTETEDGQIQEHHFSDYREFEGLTLFLKSTSWRKGERFGELTLRTIHFLPKVDPDLFDPPQSPQPNLADIAQLEKSASGFDTQNVLVLFALLLLLGCIIVVAWSLNRRKSRPVA